MQGNFADLETVDENRYARPTPPCAHPTFIKKHRCDKTENIQNAIECAKNRHAKYPITITYTIFFGDAYYQNVQGLCVSQVGAEIALHLYQAINCINTMKF